MIAATAFVLGLAAVGGFVSADMATSGTHSPMSSLVTAISTKFGLNTADVQAVVDNVITTERSAMEAKQAQASLTRLRAAVTAGKLTQAQADLITAKVAELIAAQDASHTANATLTPAERQAKMQTEQVSLKAWATANNIPAEFMRLIGVGGGRGHSGPGFHGKGVAPATSSTTTQ